MPAYAMNLRPAIQLVSPDAATCPRSTGPWKRFLSSLKTGASAALDTQTARQPVLGYALSNAGLMANLSIDGTKVNKLDL